MAHALYIHWPFCLKKCPYCDFNSHVRDRVDHELWLERMLQDMAFEHEQSSEGPLTSIFFGGGTPSLMPPSLVGALLSRAEHLWGFGEAIEITLEANPSSVEAANFDALAKAGVNRVSLGLQALDDAALKFLGRLHSVEEGLAALDVAQGAFERVSFDLIYARPNQTAKQWESELGRALSFGTRHLSLYQLTIEPNTRFATDVRLGNFVPLEDDPSADLFQLTRELTAAAGLPAYEISNHAAPGEESRHNLTYWRYQDYHGIGPGAHGRRGGFATMRHRKPENWLSALEVSGHGLKECRALDAAEAASEAMLMGLRLAEGIDVGDIAQRFRFDAAQLVDQAKLRLFENLGLVKTSGQHIEVMDKGFAVLDALLGELVATELVLS